VPVSEEPAVRHSPGEAYRLLGVPGIVFAAGVRFKAARQCNPDLCDPKNA
jgi:hypothetical protein